MSPKKITLTPHFLLYLYCAPRSIMLAVSHPSLIGADCSNTIFGFNLPVTRGS